MGRLTEHDLVGQNNAEPIVTACNNCDIWKQLCEYKDLEEAGRLYVLACGIEKPLYALTPQLDWKDGHLKAKWRISTVVPRNVEECLLWEDDMKRGLAFLTKEEAEAKLKELKK